jgi:hypothetical protein
MGTISSESKRQSAGCLFFPFIPAFAQPEGFADTEFEVGFKIWEPLRPQARAAHIQQHHLGIANYAAHYAYNMV